MRWAHDRWPYRRQVTTEVAPGTQLNLNYTGALAQSGRASDSNSSVQGSNPRGHTTSFDFRNRANLRVRAGQYWFVPAGLIATSMDDGGRGRWRTMQPPTDSEDGIVVKVSRRASPSDGFSYLTVG